VVNRSGPDSEHEAGALREAEEKLLFQKGEHPASSSSDEESPSDADKESEEDDDAAEERGTEDRKA
jgi:hypothetical protein